MPDLIEKNMCSPILVIESAKSELDLLQKILTGLEHYVEILHTADKALEKIKECSPEIIFFDVNIKGKNYLDLIGEIRNLSNEYEPIIILLSSSTTINEKVLEGLKSGANDFIRKPFNNEEMRIKIHNLLKLKEHEKNIENLNKSLEHERNRIKEERDLLAKYFSKDLIDGILNGEISTKLGGEIRIASVLFCDLRNSTEIAESTEPDVFYKFLNNLFTDITDIIYGESGSVNKFLGDGILATFGCPKNIDDDAYHCAKVAVKIRKYLLNFNQFRPGYLKIPIEMGVGMARGKLFIGNIGSINQIEYTVLGDPVNTASRLEQLTKKGNVDILMDGNIKQNIEDRAVCKRVSLTELRGKRKEIEIYYLKDIQ